MTVRLLLLSFLCIASAQERRLFLDPLVIDSQSGLERVFHKAEKFSDNPVVRADTPWEKDTSGPYLYGTVLRENGKFRMWYHFIRRGYRNAYAESEDGIHWTKPNLGIVEFNGSRANNLVTEPGCHNPSVVPTPGGDGPRKYALFCYGADVNKVRSAFSRDGLHWSFTTGDGLFESSDVVDFFYDPYGKRYAATWKGHTRRGRAVGVATSSDAAVWHKPVEGPVFAADDLDPPDTQVYGMPVFAYQGLYIGMPWIYHALPHYAPEMRMTREEAEKRSPCTVDVQLAWSHDLIHWTRPPAREPFIERGPTGSFDSGMVYTARAPVEVGDKLYFYYGGFDKPHNAKKFKGAIGLATLRLDGFVSMRAGAAGGWLITRREELARPEIVINAVTRGAGEIRAELLDAGGNAIPGFTVAECVPFRGDSVRHAIRWKTTAPLPPGVVHIRFHLRDADLFSYLV